MKFSFKLPVDTPSFERVYILFMFYFYYYLKN